MKLSLQINWPRCVAVYRKQLSKTDCEYNPILEWRYQWISLLRWSVNTQVQNSDVITSLCGYSSVSGAWINGVCTMFELSGNCKCYILKFKFLLFIEWTSTSYHVLFWVIIWNKIKHWKKNTINCAIIILSVSFQSWAGKDISRYWRLKIQSIWMFTLWTYQTCNLELFYVILTCKIYKIYFYNVFHVLH